MTTAHTPGVYARTYQQKKPINVDEQHRCPDCGAKHRSPKAYRAVIAFAWALTLIAFQVLAALELDNWLSWALWAIAARNVIVMIMLIVGLAIMAAEQPEESR